MAKAKKTKPKAKPKSKAKPRSKAKPVGKAKPALTAKPKSKAKPQMKAKPKGKAKPILKTKPAAKNASVKAKPQAKAKAKPAVKAPAQKQNQNWSSMISPLDDRILVQVDAAETMTSGGLHIPDSVQAQANFRGRVVSVGPGHRDKKGRFRPLELKVGDRILFSEYAGAEITLENQSFKILRETDVLGLLA